MCPPGQGMSGRVYQIDAGWMGGAASIGYGQLLFWPVEFGDIGLDRHWCCGLGEGFNVFLKMLTRRWAWRIFPRNSKRLAAKKDSRRIAGWRKAPRSPDTT